MSGTLRAGDRVGARSILFEVAWSGLVRKLSIGVFLGAFFALLATFAAPSALAGEFDTDKWTARVLKCDGFDDNRCYRYVDRRRRNKPYLQPHKYVEEPDRYTVKTVRKRFHHYPTHYKRYADMYYGRSRHHHDHWRSHKKRDHWDDDRWDKDRGHRDRWEKDRWEKDRWDRDREDRWAYRTAEGRYERQCLYLITTKGAEAQTENGALISAKRAWRASVRADFGERYQDLNNSRRAEYRCWRSSTNESALGRAGEWLTGQYRKRCQVWAVPCLGDRQRLEGDEDDKE